MQRKRKVNFGFLMVVYPANNKLRIETDSQARKKDVMILQKKNDTKSNNFFKIKE
jgi:hypothetical protein